VAIWLILGRAAWRADILSPNEAVRRSLEPNAVHEYTPCLVQPTRIWSWRSMA